MRALIMGNPVARAFAIAGDAWTLLILREAFHGVRRFGVWHERLGTPRSVLTDRLQRLVTAGLLEHCELSDERRMEYRLTAMGRDLYGAAVMLGQWERDWAQSPYQARQSIVYFDRETGRRLTPVTLSRVQGVEVPHDEVAWTPGPGLKIIAAPTSRRRRTAALESDRPIIARSTEIMGDYWSWAVLSAAFLRVRRFDEIHAALGVATNILADRLGHLVRQGVMERRAYQSSPPRFEYRLTEAGRAFYPVVLALHGWSESWLVGPDEAPLTLRHRRTGEMINPVVCDRTSGEPLDPRQTRWAVEATLVDDRARVRA